MSESKPIDTTAEVIKLVPIPRRKSTHGMFRTGENRRARLDVSRELTDSSKDYMVQRIKEELSSFAPNAAIDIQKLRETVLHLGEIIQKNTGEKITGKTNEESQIEHDEDEGKRMLWSSILWENGSIRVITSGQNDPLDPKLGYFATGGTGQMTVDGAGKASITNGVEPIITVAQQNYNSTVTMNVQFGNTMSAMDINVRNRDTAACQFAGYITTFDWESNGIYFYKAPVAGLYSDAQAFVDLSTIGVTLSFDTPTWIRSKIEGRPDTNVRLSAYVMKDGQWIQATSWIDTDANDEMGTLDAGETTIMTTCAASGDMITSSVANMIKPWRKPGAQFYLQAYANPASNPVNEWQINSIEITSP